MKLHLYSPFPPGAFPFEQVLDGKVIKFPDIGLDIQQQAHVLLKFRLANRLSRSTLTECIEDIDLFTCSRLGNDPRWCSDGTTKPKAQKVQRRGCATCGFRSK